MLHISTQEVFSKTNSKSLSNIYRIFDIPNQILWYLRDDSERLRELRPQCLEVPEDLALLQDLRLCNDLLIFREQLEAFWGEASTRYPTLISSLQRENTVAEAEL